MKVTAKNSIKHDGQLFKAGESLEVNDKQAADLLAAGVIEPVKGIKASKPEEAPDKSVDTPDDKKAEQKGTEEVANLAVDRKMKKEKLRGIALAMGLEVEKTMTGPEIYEMIVDKRGGESSKENTTGGAEETNEDPTGAENNQSKEDVKESKDASK